MKVNIDLSESHEETSITVHAKEWSEEVERLVKMIRLGHPTRIVGSDQDQSILLYPREIDYVYAERRKVIAVTKKGRYELKMKLFEVESILEPHQFIRFSKSVVGNIDQIQQFELSFNGSLHVYFKSGNKEYVSRHYVSRLKEKLIIGGSVNGI